MPENFIRTKFENFFYINVIAKKLKILNFLNKFEKFL